MHQTGQNVTAIAVAAQRMLGGHGRQLILGDLDDARLIGGNEVCKNNDQDNADQQEQADHGTFILFQAAEDLFGLTGTLEVNVPVIERFHNGTGRRFRH